MDYRAALASRALSRVLFFRLFCDCVYKEKSFFFPLPIHLQIRPVLISFYWLYCHRPLTGVQERSGKLYSHSIDATTTHFRWPSTFPSTDAPRRGGKIFTLVSNIPTPPPSSPNTRFSSPNFHPHQTATTRSSLIISSTRCRP